MGIIQFHLILPVSLISTFIKNLEDFILIQDKRFFNMVKESKKLTPESETLLKEAINSVITQLK